MDIFLIILTQVLSTLSDEKQYELIMRLAHEADTLPEGSTAHEGLDELIGNLKLGMAERNR